MCAYAQEDKIWIVSPYASKLFSDSPNFNLDTFNHGVVTDGCAATSSTKSGSLNFFTTGTKVLDRNGDLMENGDSTCDDIFLKYYSRNGMLCNQSVLTFPRGYSLYWIVQTLYSDSQLTLGGPLYNDRIYYHTVDMRANGGLGKVTSKKNFLYGEAVAEDHFTACKHANGRDYWLIAVKYQDSTYVKFLVTPDSILGPYYQTIGSAYFEPDYRGALCFSADGSRFAGIGARSKLNIMDFDRCTGEFSNAVSLVIPNDTVWYQGQTQIVGNGANGVAFSPSGRFLYLLGYQFIRQYNLNDFFSQVVWQWDSTYGFTFTNEGYLSYNGKIIISNYHGLGSHGYHTIEYPDSPGMACRFKWNSVVTHPPILNYNCLNNTFNYRLGALAGSGCDTIRTAVKDIEKEKRIHIYPNPATDQVIVELYEYLKNAQLAIYDNAQRLVYSKPDMFMETKVDISKWPTGIYTVQVRNEQKVWEERMIKR
ncbi:MAG: T9SS type A sorting domain-containing protein [Chitinophagales bacterium]